MSAPIGRYWPGLVVLLLGLLIAQDARTDDRLRIGVTLHPYYAWVANIAGDAAEVVPVVPAHADPHGYQPRPEDIQRLTTLDVLVVNGLGHDAFMEPMVGAANRDDLPVIEPNREVPLIPIHSDADGDAEAGPTTVQMNSHSFLSVTSAIHQVHAIAERLGQLDPAHASQYRENARIYARRLRRLLGEALAALATVDPGAVRIATVHDGYAYLFQELGIEIAAVVQPRHGIDPSPAQVADTIRRLKQARVQILFTELDYGRRFAEVVATEAGTRVFELTHISRGPYTPDAFEQGMAQNLRTIVDALVGPR